MCVCVCTLPWNIYHGSCEPILTSLETLDVQAYCGIIYNNNNNKKKKTPGVGLHIPSKNTDGHKIAFLYEIKKKESS